MNDVDNGRFAQNIKKTKIIELITEYAPECVYINCWKMLSFRTTLLGKHEKR